MAGESRRARSPSEVSGFVAGRRRSDVRVAAGALALVGATAIALLRFVRNAPVDAVILAEPAVYGVASALAVAGPAVAAIGLGVVARTDREWVALVFAGTFTLLTLATGAVSVPAAAVVVAAGALTLLPRVPSRTRRTVVAGGFVAALALSLGGGMGVLPASARSTGTTVTLLAVAAMPLAVRPSPPALLAGFAAALAVAAATLSAPFASSASVLVVGAAIDPSFVLLAAAVGGAVTVIASGVSAGRTITALGGGLLLAAGVPATVPRALAVVLGARLVLGSPVTPADGGDDDAV